MVVDFATIKEAYQKVIEPFVEHRDLNETLDLPEYTTEYIVIWAWTQLHPILPTLYKLRLWEGKTSYAEFCSGDQLRQ